MWNAQYVSKSPLSMTARSLRMASAPSTPTRSRRWRGDHRSDAGTVLYYSGRDRPAGRECLVVAQVLRVVRQVAHARLHAGSPVIGQPARTGLRGDRLGDMPGPA